MKFLIRLIVFVMFSEFVYSQNEPYKLCHSDKYGNAIEYYKVKDSIGTIAAQIQGNRLYTIGSGIVSIYDISQSDNPILLGCSKFLGNLRQLEVRGKYAYIAARASGFLIVDISNEKNIKLLSHFDSVEMATGLDVAGNVAFIGNRVYGIQGVDISNPYEPKNIFAIKTDESQSLLFDGGKLYNGDWAAGEIKVFDLKDLKEPKLISRIGLNGFGDGLCVEGNYLFAATGHHLKDKNMPLKERHSKGHGLDIFNIENLKDVKFVSRLCLPQFYMGPSDFWNVKKIGDYCFVNDTANGFFLIDVSDIKNPKCKGNLKLPEYRKGVSDPLGCIAINNDIVYLCGEHTGLYYEKLKGIAKFKEREFKNEPKIPVDLDFSEDGFISSGESRKSPVRAVAIYGDYAYAACADEGIKIFKLSENSIDYIGTHKLEFASDVKIRNNKLFCAERKSGIGIYNIQPNYSLKESSRIKSIDKKNKYDEAHYMWLPSNSDILAVSLCQDSIYFYDAGNIHNIKFLYKINNLGGMIYGNTASNELACGKYFAISTFSGAIIYDISNKAKPKIVLQDLRRSASQTSNATVFKDEILFTRFNGYAFINPENPKNIKDWNISKFPDKDNTEILEGYPEDNKLSAPICGEIQNSQKEGLASVNGNIIAISNRMYKTIRVYDFCDKNKPILLRSYKMKNNPNIASFWKDRLVVPCGYSGLLLENKQ